MNTEEGITIFASGSGTNAMNIIANTKFSKSLRVNCLICNVPEAPIINKATKSGIEVIVIDSRKVDRQEFEKRSLDILRKKNTEWIFLAGFMRILSPYFIRGFENLTQAKNRIINIHPSLLPAYPGVDSYQRAYKDNKKTHGVTLHYVDEGVDTGKIIMQKCYSRKENMTFKEFQSQGLSLEYECYQEFIQSIQKNAVQDEQSQKY